MQGQGLLRLETGKAGEDPLRGVSRPALSLLRSIVEGGKGEKKKCTTLHSCTALAKTATIHRSLGHIESDKGIS